MSQSAFTRQICVRIRALRREHGMTHEELAAAAASHQADLPRNVIINLEHGHRDHVTAAEIDVLAKIFGKSVHWMMYGTGPIYECAACNNRPPAGFTCNLCGQSTRSPSDPHIDESVFLATYVPRPGNN